MRLKEDVTLERTRFLAQRTFGNAYEHSTKPVIMCRGPTSHLSVDVLSEQVLPGATRNRRNHSRPCLILFYVARP